MKRILGVLVALAMVASCFGAGFSAMAGGGDDRVRVEFPGSSGFWVWEDDPTVLVRYTGSAKDVVIPNGITEIVYYAFDGEYEITSVSIPSSVITVDGESFAYCTSIKQINVNSNNAKYSSVDGVLFNKNKTELICYPAGKVASTYTIPNSVKTIGNGAFVGCDFIVSISIPSGVTSIGYSAFQDCTSLKTVNIPSGVTSIGTYAFYGCSSIESVNIPNGVKTIGSSVFSYCTSLKSVSIPNSVKTIGYFAFENCSSLKSLYIPTSVTEIEWGAFDDTTTLRVFEGSYAHQWASQNQQTYVLLFVAEIKEAKDVLDVMILAVSGATLSAAQVAVADLNKDSKVDAVDALMALKIVIGL